MGIVAEKDSTTQPTTRLDLSASLKEMKKADNQLDFKQYTNRQKKQAFLIVHNSESFLQRVSADHTLLSIGMKANSIYQITGRPVPPTIDQTIGAASNMISPDMGRAETNAVANPIDVSSASPATSESTTAPERMQDLNYRLPSSKRFLHLHFTHNRMRHVTIFCHIF